MRFLKYGLFAAIAYVAWLVYKKMSKPADVANPTTTAARQPGAVGDLLSGIVGSLRPFNTAQETPVSPPIPSAFGTIYAPSDPTNDFSYYTNQNATNVPAFLEGSTGGVADDARTGDSPPPNIGIPGAVGTGANSPEADPHLPAPMSNYVDAMKPVTIVTVPRVSPTSSLSLRAVAQR